MVQSRYNRDFPYFQDGPRRHPGFWKKTAIVGTWHHPDLISRGSEDSKSVLTSNSCFFSRGSNWDSSGLLCTLDKILFSTTCVCVSVCLSVCEWATGHTFWLIEAYIVDNDVPFYVEVLHRLLWQSVVELKQVFLVHCDLRGWIGGGW